MRFIDLCSGIGGFRLGFERAGMECIGYCEIDKFARASYEAMYGTDEWRAADIRLVSDYEISQIGDFDLLCGGFPCQPFSIAGKRKGTADPRGNIFGELMRFIRIRKPRWVVFENVPNLLRIEGGKVFARILYSLGECGYCVAWQLCNSKNYGVPQNRKRLYIVGSHGTGAAAKVFHFGEVGEAAKGTLQTLTNGGCQAVRVFHPNGIATTLIANGGGWGGRTGLYDVGCGIRELSPKEAWRVQGFPDELFEKAAAITSDRQLYRQAGNAVTVPIAEWIGKSIMEIEHGYTNR